MVISEKTASFSLKLHFSLLKMVDFNYNSDNLVEVIDQFFIYTQIVTPKKFHSNECEFYIFLS